MIRGRFPATGSHTNIVPSSVPSGGDGVCDPRTAYRAYVTFPSCNLIAHIDLSTGS